MVILEQCMTGEWSDAALKVWFHASAVLVSILEFHYVSGVIGGYLLKTWYSSINVLHSKFGSPPWNIIQILNWILLIKLVIVDQIYLKFQLSLSWTLTYRARFLVMKKKHLSSFALEFDFIDPSSKKHCIFLQSARSRNIWQASHVYLPPPS